MFEHMRPMNWPTSLNIETLHVNIAYPIYSSYIAMYNYNNEQEFEKGVTNVLI